MQAKDYLGRTVTRMGQLLGGQKLEKLVKFKGDD